jgi:hypothetical protein
MLTVGAIERISPANFCKHNPSPTPWTRLPRFLKDMPAMDRLSFATEQVALRSPQGDPFREHFYNSIM